MYLRIKIMSENIESQACFYRKNLIINDLANILNESCFLNYIFIVLIYLVLFYESVFNLYVFLCNICIQCLKRPEEDI